MFESRALRDKGASHDERSPLSTGVAASILSFFFLPFNERQAPFLNLYICVLNRNTRTWPGRGPAVTAGEAEPTVVAGEL